MPGLDYSISGDFGPSGVSAGLLDDEIRAANPLPTAVFLYVQVGRQVDGTLDSDAVSIITQNAVPGGEETATDVVIAAHPASAPPDDPGSSPDVARTTDPTVTDDDSEGFGIGSRWHNTAANRTWTCFDASTGAAVWRQDTVIVQSVNTQTGVVVLGAGDVGADPAGTAAAAVSTHEGLADPHAVYQLESEKDQVNGYAGLDGSTLLAAAQLPEFVGDSGAGGTKGAVPAPASGDGAADKVLHADGTWKTTRASAGLLSGLWQFEDDTGDADPGSGNFRLNNSTQTSATFIYVSDETKNGVDAANILLALDTDDRIYLQEDEDSSRFHLVRLTGPAVDAGNYVRLPIAFEDSGSDLTDGSEIVWVLYFTGGGGGTGDVTAAANLTDNAVIRGDGGAKGVQDSGLTIDDNDKLFIPGSSNEEYIELGDDANFNIIMGKDSGGTAFLSRTGGAGTFRMSHNADNPQWLLGNDATDVGNCFIDADAATGGSRELRLNTLAGAGNGGAVVVGDGGLVPNNTGNTPLGEAARKFQRGEINHLVSGVDVFSAVGTIDDATFVVAQDGTYTLTLPTAAEGWSYVIERQGSTGTVTLAPDAGDTINGGGSIALEANDVYLIFAQDATDWRVLNLTMGDDNPYDAIVPDDFALPSLAFAAPGVKTVFVKSGTFTETADVMIPEDGALIGEGIEATTIDLSGGFSVIADGSGRETSTGTISITHGTTAVTGVGTSFTTLLPGDYLLIGIGDKCWWRIDSIANDTSLTLVRNYEGQTVAGGVFEGKSLLKGVTVRDMTVRDNAAGAGIVLRNITGGLVQNIAVVDCGVAGGTPEAAVLVEDSVTTIFQSMGVLGGPHHGIEVNDSNANTFNGFNIQGCAAVGLFITGANQDSTFESGNICATGGNGVTVTGGSDETLFNNCVISETNAGGVSIDAGTGDTHIRNTTIRNVATFGIEALGGTGGSAQSCQISSNGGAGLIVSEDTFQVNDCLIRGNAGDGVQVTVANVVVDGNRIASNGGAGVSFTADDCICSNNRIVGNTGDGVSIAASADRTRLNGNTVTGNGTDINDLSSTTIYDAPSTGTLTDNALLKGDTSVPGGTGVQSSGITVDDSNNLTGVGTINGISIGEADSIREEFTKVASGLSVGDVVRHAGPNPEDWVQALADTGDNAEALGIVSAVAGNDFTITYAGRINGLSGLTAGMTHFLSDSVAGALTATSPSISRPMLFATSATSGVVLVMRSMQGNPPPLTYRVPHTWAISGEIEVPSGQTDFIIPFYISLASGQTAALVKARYSINGGTSATVDLQLNGSPLANYTGLSVTTTPTSTDPADVALSEDDELSIEVQSVSGTPENLTFTIFIEYTR